MTGSELQQLLPAVKLTEFEPGSSKRERLAVTLNNAQVRRKRGDTLVVDLNAAMEPARYTRDPGRLDQLRDELNEVLALPRGRSSRSG